MSDENLNETIPMRTGASNAGETVPVQTRGAESSPQTDPSPTENELPSVDNGGSSDGTTPPTKKRRFGWFGPLLIGWLILFVVAALSGYTGYNTAISDRIAQQSTQAVETLDNQYQLALENFTAGEYELARQRLEYILAQDPNYAKAQVLLAQTLSVILATATPTPVRPTATPTLTPTPDLRGVEEIFNSARTAMLQEDWDTAISTLLTLRKKEPAFRAVDVDSMLYVAFRYRGVHKILNTGELEGGLLDLSQAELFGPIDSEARSYANFARLFGIGVSFWEVDWGQAVYYFGQVAPFLPNMHNGDNWYASQRYLEALQHYIDQLVASKDFCEAQVQMEILVNFSGDPALQPTKDSIDKACKGGSDEKDEDEDEGDGSSEATPTPPPPTAPSEATATPEPTRPEEPAPTETPSP